MAVAEYDTPLYAVRQQLQVVCGHIAVPMVCLSSPATVSHWWSHEGGGRKMMKRLGVSGGWIKPRKGTIMAAASPRF